MNNSNKVIFARFIEVNLLLAILFLIGLLLWKPFTLTQPEQLVEKLPKAQKEVQTDISKAEKDQVESVEKPNPAQSNIAESDAPKAGPQKPKPQEAKTENAKKTSAPDKAAPEVKVGPPTFQVVNLAQDGKIRLAGLAPAGWTLELRSLGKLIGIISAIGESGEWIYISPENLQPGDYKVELLVISPDKKKRVVSNQVLTFTIPADYDVLPKVMRLETGKDPVVLQQKKQIAKVGQEKSAPSQQVAEPKRAIQEVQKDKAEKAPLPLVTLGKIDYKYDNNTSGKLTLSGTGLPDGQLRILVDKKIVGTVQSNAQGQWLFDKEIALKQGNRDIRVEHIDNSGDIVGFTDTVYNLKSPVATAKVDRGEISAKQTLDNQVVTANLATPEKKPQLADTKVNSTAVAKPKAQKPQEKTKSVSQKKSHSDSKIAKARKTKARKAKTRRTKAKKYRTARRTNVTSKRSHRKKRYNRKRVKRRNCIVIVKKGDTLWQIASNRYRNGFKYKRIHRRNRNIVKDPDLIFPGQRLIIPR